MKLPDREFLYPRFLKGDACFQLSDLMSANLAPKAPSLPGLVWLTSSHGLHPRNRLSPRCQSGTVLLVVQAMNSPGNWQIMCLCQRQLTLLSVQADPTEAGLSSQCVNPIKVSLRPIPVRTVRHYRGKVCQSLGIGAVSRAFTVDMKTVCCMLRECLFAKS